MKIMKDFTANHISTEKAKILFRLINIEVKKYYPDVEIYSGVGYRGLMVVKNTNFNGLTTIPPHDITYKDTLEYLPIGTNSDMINHIMEISENVLNNLNISSIDNIR